MGKVGYCIDRKAILRHYPPPRRQAMEIKVEYKNSKTAQEWQQFGTLNDPGHRAALKFLDAHHGAKIYRLNNKEYEARR